MIFDPFTPTVCKWVHKSEGWYNCFPAHTHRFLLCVCVFVSVSLIEANATLVLMWITCLRKHAQFLLCLPCTTAFSLLYVCLCLLLNNKWPEASEQHRKNYRKMDLLSCNWASSICCYGSGWEGNQIPPPPTVSPNHPSSQTLLLSLLTKDWGEMCNTRWSNTLRFMDNALSQTVSEYIDCLFLVIEM